MALVKMLEYNIRLQKKVSKRLEELEMFYSMGRSTFILKEIMQLSKQLVELKNEENQLHSILNKTLKKQNKKVLIKEV